MSDVVELSWSEFVRMKHDLLLYRQLAARYRSNGFSVVIKGIEIKVSPDE